MFAVKRNQVLQRCKALFLLLCMVVMSVYHPAGMVWTYVWLGLTLLCFLCFLVGWWRRALLQQWKPVR